MKKIDKDLIEFINKSPVPVFSVKETEKRLIRAGFKRISENSSQKLKGGKYYIRRKLSSLSAFVIPPKLSKKPAFRIFASHNDSPVLKLRTFKLINKKNYLQIEVEPYGGLISSSWFDRELSLAGILITKENNEFKEHFINIKKNPVILPGLAIHLNRDLNKEGFKVNKEKHLPLLLGLGKDKNEFIDFVAAKAKVRPRDILGFELSFYDSRKAVSGGLHNEFIFSSRLDDLFMLHSGLISIINTAKHKKRKRDIIPVFSVFDHEEIGSLSNLGAASNFFTNTLESIKRSLSFGRDDFLAMQNRSLLFSGDMAHAYHPNYPEKYTENSSVLMGEGPVLKLNSNQRYSTSAEGAAFFTDLCRTLNIPYQIYHHRNDIPCGSTIGPTLAASGGMTVVDTGAAMLAMHSIRETAALKDHGYFIKLLQGFYTL